MEGFLIDKEWTISQLVVVVKKDNLDEVGFEQKHKLMEIALVNLPTTTLKVKSSK